VEPKSESKVVEGRESGNRVRFGAFEADLGAGLLRKNGRRVRLQEQPFQILAALLERPGEVVTREELRTRLWSGQSFGDFDQGLNTAINKLRDALEDSAANPRFIETLPKRGYRFTLPVEAEAAKLVLMEPTQAPKLPRRLRSRTWVGAVILLAAAGIIIGWLLRPAPDSLLPLRRFPVSSPIPFGGSPIYSSVVAASPDGRHIAFSINDARGAVWLQTLDQQQPRAIPGSEGGYAPFWSPDSRYIGFAAGAVLKRASLAGGSPTQICELPHPNFFGGAWSPDDQSVVFASGTPSALYQVPATGGTPAAILTADSLRRLADAKSETQDSRHVCFYNPHFLPEQAGSRVLLFTVGPVDPAIMVHDLERGRTQLLGYGDLPFYSATGHVVFRSGKTSSDLWARPFSLDDLRPTRPAFQIAANATDPSVARDGTLVYVDSFSDQLVWLDRRGRKVAPVEPPAQGMYYPALSPDARLAAVEALENGNLDIWVHDLAAGARTRLSMDAAHEILPVWSPDGTEVAYASYRSGNIDILLRRADGSEDEKMIAGTVHQERVSDWSRDGRYILYSLQHPDTKGDIWSLERQPEGWTARPFLQTPADERMPKLSPDGRYVAYVSDESGRPELYVQSFPSAAGKRAISSGGASQPRWRNNGRELFYVEGNVLISVAMRTQPALSMGPATRLFAHSAFAVSLDANYDVSPDGRASSCQNVLARRARNG
jgi:Tol biopolymer transport system component/DNA-binding winged helix-turn-helix (wHTH) protein